MKRIFITILIVLSTVSSAYAQYADKVSYRNLKDTYDYKDYVRQGTDPYNVSWYGFTSFFAPGTGQLLSGEVGRGFAFMGAEAVLLSIIYSAARNIEEVAVTNDSGFLIGYTDESRGKKNMAVLLSALGVDLGLSIWSCIDAKRVAKVKNMYYQDLIGNRLPVEMSFAPTVSFVPATGSGSLRPTAGLAMQLKF